MTLPPLANLFAARDDDPRVLQAIAARLEAAGEFPLVWRPAPGWIAAAAPLPGRQPAWCAAGFAVAEGEDSLAARGAEVAALADGPAAGLRSLAGDFGFIRFRPDGGATVVRSAGGLVPFYIREAGAHAAVATRLGDLVRYGEDPGVLDPLVNAVWTTGFAMFPDGRSFLAGARILARGTLARLEPGRPRIEEGYWDPRPTRLEFPTDRAARQHAVRLRELLVAALERDLDPRGGNLLTLSGGVDSSCLLALATGVVGRPVWTWSLLPEPEQLFQREMSYIAPLASRCGVARSWTVRHHPGTLVELIRAGPRVVCHVPHAALCALPAVVREAPVSVLFGGEFADEVCGSSFTWPDWVSHTPLSELARRWRALPTGPRDVLRWAKRRLLDLAGRPAHPFPTDLPRFIRPEIREEYREWLDRRLHAARLDRGSWRYLALRAEVDGFLAMNWEVASALRVRRSFPFFNREALELAFACHPAEKIGPGTKRLLKAALKDDVPEHNLYRPDKGHWGPAASGEGPCHWDTPLPDELSAVVREDWIPVPRGPVQRSEARGLAQLVALAEAVRERRAGRA